MSHGQYTMYLSCTCVICRLFLCVFFFGGVEQREEVHVHSGSTLYMYMYLQWQKDLGKSQIIYRVVDFHSLGK